MTLLIFVFESNSNVKTLNHSPGEKKDGSIAVDNSRQRAASEYCEKSGRPAPVGYSGSTTRERTYVENTVSVFFFFRI